MEQAQGKFTSMLPTQDVNSARHLLQQHQDIKKSEYRLSLSTKTVVTVSLSLLFASISDSQQLVIKDEVKNKHLKTFII